MKIPTKDDAGKPNGYVLTVWNALERPELQPAQVYLTAIHPHCQKGPHLHLKRRGLFCCIKGNIRLVCRDKGEYFTYYSGVDYGYAVLEVPPGIPACLYNFEDETALVLNLPNPAWSKDQQDEHPVENWVP